MIKKKLSSSFDTVYVDCSESYSRPITRKEIKTPNLNLIPGFLFIAAGFIVYIVACNKIAKNFKTEEEEQEEREQEERAQKKKDAPAAKVKASRELLFLKDEQSQENLENIRMGESMSARDMSKLEVNSSASMKPIIPKRSQVIGAKSKTGSELSAPQRLRKNTSKPSPAGTPEPDPTKMQ